MTPQEANTMFEPFQFVVSYYDTIFLMKEDQI